jgi:hypothetical protein
MFQCTTDWYKARIFSASLASPVIGAEIVDPQIAAMGSGHRAGRIDRFESERAIPANARILAARAWPRKVAALAAHSQLGYQS